MVQKVRLYLDCPLVPGQPASLSREQAHYLFNVMRLVPGDRVHVFNGHAGEWLAEVAEAGKRGGSLRMVELTAPQRDPPDLWLLFAPLKRARTDFVVEKATELGAARLVPVQTEFTNAERVRADRMQAIAIEAAEQCGGTFVPAIADMAPLGRLLDGWPEGRRILWCDEGLAGNAEAGLADAPPGPWAVLIGPEGGFSPAERARLHGLSFVHPVTLGPRILRADTAAVAALTLWQDRLGDWH